MPRTLYLIDTYAQIFRSYFAIRNGMRSPVTGEPTQAVFGMTAFLLKLLTKHRPDFVVAVIDVAGPTFRDAISDNYKGTRRETPPDLSAQIPRVFELIDALGILRVGCSGLEADDLIAGITRRVIGDPDCGDVVVRIASKDKDLLQLLGDRVTLFDVQTETTTDAAALLATKGITPGQVIDFLTLTGDTVDNIPGVPGIGPKTAASLLQSFGNLDMIYRNLERLPARQQESLAAAREQTHKSRDMVTLRGDEDLSFSLADARLRGIDVPAVHELFERLNFHRFRIEIDRLIGWSPEDGIPSEGLFEGAQAAAAILARR